MRNRCQRAILSSRFPARNSAPAPDMNERITPAAGATLASMFARAECWIGATASVVRHRLAVKY